MSSETSDAVRHYFTTIGAALGGLQSWLADPALMLPGSGLPASLIVPAVARLKNSFTAWENRIGFSQAFRISRAESGFPVFQNVLELENDRASADKRLASIPDAAALKAEMADFILRVREFPRELQSRMAERIYLESLKRGEVFSPFVLPETVHVSVNPENRRVRTVVVWGAFDGSQTLPMIYVATIEDSSENVTDLLVTKDGKLNDETDVPLPVGGLLNPQLAAQFDDFVQKNSAYSLSPATIAQNLDKDFPTLHPKSLRRIVLGPFYSAGITENNARINDVLSKVRKPENAWLLTWTMQEVFAASEIPEKRGFFSSSPAVQQFHIETNDLEAARMGVSAYEKHALVPHDAYQALYAAGEAASIFGNYRVHVISGTNVISEV